MTVTDIQKDLESQRMTITAELDAPVERAWQLWANPRQLERWWGPPTYPATFVDHDLTPGGRVSYYMTSPEGEKFGGWWEILAVDAPHRLELRDGFADGDGAPNDDMPVTTMVVTLSDGADGGTRMVLESQFESREAMERLLEMGMDEGIQAAMSQIPAILADPAAA